MSGCFRGVLRLGCLIVVLAAAAGAWWFRKPLLHRASHLFGRHETPLPAVDTTVGAPTPKALASTQRKMDRLERPAGPDSVVLSANEVASLIGGSLDWSVRKSFDSLRVELLEGSIAVYCRLDTRTLPPDVLGPLGAMLDPFEPLRLAGPVHIERPGLARWRVDEIALRGVAFPTEIVTALARRVAGADSTGAVPLPVSPAFRSMAIHPAGVILYRMAARAREPA